MVTEREGERWGRQRGVTRKESGGRQRGVTEREGERWGRQRGERGDKEGEWG